MKLSSLVARLAFVGFLVPLQSASAQEVLVDKSAAGAENYVLTFHCVTGPDGTGLHTGTDVIARQNQ